MEKTHYKILIVEDVPSDAELVQNALHADGIQFESKVTMNKESFLAELDSFMPDIILSDYNIPQFSGPEALEITQKKLPGVPFIFVSGSIGEERVVESFRKGAIDYILKDRLVDLLPSVMRAIADIQTKNNLLMKTNALEQLVHSMTDREMKMIELKEIIVTLKEEIIKLNIVRPI